MKKIYLVLIFAAAIVTADAQQVFKEYFADQALIGTNLEDYNDWYVCGKEAEAYGVSPTITGEMLFYDDYFGSDGGYAVLLDSTVGKDGTTQRISTKLFTLNDDTVEVGAAGNTYYAAMILMIGENSYSSYRDFFTWEGSTTGNWSRGRVFAKVSDNSDITFAVSKNSSSDLGESEIMTGAVNINHLVVLKYEVVGDVAEDDIISLYINPDPKAAEPVGDAIVNIDTKSDYNADTELKINLRQRGVGALVGNIRVGTDWAEVMDGYEGEAGVGVKPTKAANSIYAYQKSIITNAPGTVHVFDITGRKVMTQITTGRIDTDLNTGVYVLRFEAEKGEAVTRKVVLQ